MNIYPSKEKLYRNIYQKKYRHNKKISIKFNTKGDKNKNPWKNTYKNILTRCYHDKNSSYYKRGIKCFLTIKDLEKIWFRDSAFNMRKPSIDRLNSEENYTFKNCRYIELEQNRKPKKKESEKK